MAVKDKKARFNPFVPPTHFQQQVGWGTRLENVWVEGTLRLEYGKSGIYNNNRLPGEEEGKYQG